MIVPEGGTNAQEKPAGGANFAAHPKRPVRVADAISMAIPGDPEYYAGGTIKNRLAKFSQNGKRFVIVLRKGNSENNTNEFSLLLWNTDEVFRHDRPVKLLSMSTSSNRPAIEDVTWLGDNETLVFLGEHPGELRELYSFDIRTHLLKKLTDNSTSLIAYSVTPDADQVTYTGEEPVKSLFDNEETRRHGVVVTTEDLMGLLTDRNGSSGIQLFFKGKDTSAHELKPSGQMTSFQSPPRLSPDGRYVAMATRVPEIPKSWKSYSAPAVRIGLDQRVTPGQYSSLRTYQLIDTSTGESGVLLNSPIDYFSTVAWSPDSQSVILSGVFLPLENASGEELRARQLRSSTVEVAISSREFTKVSDGNLRVLTWDANTREAIFEAGDLGRYAHNSTILMRKDGYRWKRIDKGREDEVRPEIAVEEDMNTPPRIFAIDSGSHQRSLLLDPNPELGNLKFGRVEEITWSAKDGHEVKGGLFYPVDYVPGERYPLVIQTHAWWGKQRFHIDGPWSDNFAAQPLAGKNIMVLQAEEEQSNDLDAVARYWNTTQEIPRAVGVYEAAIDYLDKRGLIDRHRVGLVGFSRTCMYVKYALMHSKYHFAAASVMDGVDAGYFQYIRFLNSAETAQFFEGVNGALPLGKGVESWIDRSTSFGFDRVEAPVLIIAPHTARVLQEWEWFAALSRLGKPVELVMMQDGPHELEKPWDRMIAAQGTADWFSFWLRNEEDPEPTKTEQYARWRELRKLQEQNGRQPQQANPPSVH